MGNQFFMRFVLCYPNFSGNHTPSPRNLLESIQVFTDFFSFHVKMICLYLYLFVTLLLF